MADKTTSVVALSLSALFALAGLGCGGGSLNAQVAKASPFPSRDALAKLASAPVKAMAAQKVAPAIDWTVDAPEPTAPPVEARFAQVAAKTGGGITYSPELRCVAREIGRFYLEHGAKPDERLKRFIIAACGSTSPSVGTGEVTGEAPPESTDEQLLADWQAKLEIPAAYRGGVVGLWFGRKGTRIVVMTALAKPTADVVVSPADATGQVLVHGMAPADTEGVIALINQGDKGVTSCEADLATALPLFAFKCPMVEGDKTAWVEVAARARGRLLMRSIGLALARRDATAALVYSAAPREARAVGSSADLSAAVLDGVNRARAEAKLAPLTLTRAQSATNERLAPHFFAASMESDQAKADMVSLGLIAGWEVEGTIRNGNLFAALLSGSNDANGWLDYALEMPMGRHTMLHAGSRQIAIGAAPSQMLGGLGAVVTTYEFFGGTDHRADVAHVFARLSRLRAARGLPKPVAMPGMKTLGMQAALVNAGQKDADQALNEALVAERDRSGRSMRGWVLATNDLDSMPFPAEVLAAGPLTIGVEVTHFRPEGAAWGSYVVFFVMPQKDAPQTTAATRRRTSAPARF
jgi:hypothetical protein